MPVEVSTQLLPGGGVRAVARIVAAPLVDRRGLPALLALVVGRGGKATDAR
jgi:hypothetical protein